MSNRLNMFASSRFKRYETLNRNHLKLIVIILMLLEHSSCFLPVDNPIFCLLHFLVV